jgi:hypothetical protein
MGQIGRRRHIFKHLPIELLAQAEIDAEQWGGKEKASPS